MCLGGNSACSAFPGQSRDRTVKDTIYWGDPLRSYDLTLYQCRDETQGQSTSLPKGGIGENRCRKRRVLLDKLETSEPVSHPNTPLIEVTGDRRRTTRRAKEAIAKAKGGLIEHVGNRIDH
jgi:hypothetical protein